MTKIIAFKGYQHPGGKIPAAEMLRFYRTRSNLTQFELAKGIGLKSERVIRKWEKGQSLPEASRLKKLIEFYITGKFFTRFQEEIEAYNLWEAVKETFDLQSPSFETYTIFDNSWFAELSFNVYQKQNKVIQFSTGNPFPCSGSTLISGFNNVPALQDSFFGREDEIVQIREKLMLNQVLTITGPPGVGKTRLALEVCPSLAKWFKDGIALVSLGSLSGPEALPRAIGQVLGLNYAAESPTKLFSFLQNKELLLVLDLLGPFLGDSRQFIAQLLQRCEKVKILITSQESLGIGGEKNFRLEPLPVTEQNPSSQVEADLELADFSPGVQLFTERATAVQGDFVFNAPTARVIARICQQLDGLPLAIELAAQMVEVLAIEQIEARLCEPFELLKGSITNPALATNRQSLSEKFELSFSRLSSLERLALQILARIEGDFNLEIAEQRLLESGLPKKQVLELVESLLRKSLVHSQNLDEIVTFSLLKTVKSYCRYLEKRGDYFGKGD